MQIEMHSDAVQSPGMGYREESLAFLRRVVEETGQTPTALAKLVGKSPTTFTRPLAAVEWKFGIKFETLQDLSERTGIPLPESLRTAKAPKVMTGEVDLPIRYEVAASGFLPRDELRQQDDFGHQVVPVARGFEGVPQWLERVISDSMDRMLPVGSLIHVIDATAIRYKPRHGDIVVVERERLDGSLVERTVKQVSVEGDTINLCPRSHNPRWSRPVEFHEGTEDGEEFAVTIVGRVVQSYMFFEEG